MDYYLQPDFFTPPPALEISKEEYEELSLASSILSAALSFEENYDLLIGNYLELENSALSIAANIMTRKNYEYQAMFEISSELNRRAVNLLSVARLFLDQIIQRVGTCKGNIEDLKIFRSKEYENAFEYRFMEALRNHVQHSGSAIHDLSFGGETILIQQEERRIFIVNAYVLKKFLAEDKTFKKTTLAECPKKVDYIVATRIYIAALSRIHSFARNSIQEEVSKSRQLFEKTIERYASFSGGTALGLTAKSKLTPQRNPINILLNWDNVRKKLAERNRDLRDLPMNIITSGLP